MSDFNTVPAAAHRVELVGRERLVVSGVEDVDRFDETGIVMSTTAGTLVVTGEDLHIGKLSLDGGELHVDGRIDSVTYEDEGQSRGGFFSRPNRFSIPHCLPGCQRFFASKFPFLRFALFLWNFLVQFSILQFFNLRVMI